MHPFFTFCLVETDATGSSSDDTSEEEGDDEEEAAEESADSGEDAHLTSPHPF